MEFNKYVNNMYTPELLDDIKKVYKHEIYILSDEEEECCGNFFDFEEDEDATECLVIYMNPKNKMIVQIEKIYKGDFGLF